MWRELRKKCSVGYADLVIVWRVRRAANGMLFLLLQFFLNNYRGVAQLAARVVWDHEAGSSSLPTPTTKGSYSNTYTG